MLQKQGKKYSKEGWGKHAALFEAAADVEWLRGAAVELYKPLHVGVEGLNQAE